MKRKPKYPTETQLRALFSDCWRQPDKDYALSDAEQRWDAHKEWLQVYFNNDTAKLEAYFIGYCAALGDIEAIKNGNKPVSAKGLESYAKAALSKMVVPERVKFGRVVGWLRSFYKEQKEEYAL